jgi:hypothetical protein
LTESHHTSANRSPQCTRLFYFRVGVVLLLFAIAGLSTMAKNSQYYSRSNPVHYLNISSKMKMSPPAALGRTPLRPIARFVVQQPVVRFSPVVEDQVPELPSLSVTLTLQHRSPPQSLS